MNANLEKLVSQIQSVDGALKHEANKAVNKLLTIRNWLIGYYIVEYEQKGDDRAKYGDKILENVADKINREGFSYRNLKLFRQFFLSFPLIGNNIPNELLPIGQSLSAQLEIAESQAVKKGQPPTAQLKTTENQPFKIWQTPTAKNMYRY